MQRIQEQGGEEEVEGLGVGELVFQECSDIIRLQGEACHRLQQKLNNTVSREDYHTQGQLLKVEKADHEQTRQLLEEERERVRLADAELRVLRRQLEREKNTFENAFGLLKSQALTDSSKAEELLVKCAALEAVSSRKDDELASKERMIAELQRRLRDKEASRGKEVLESTLRAQQDAYVASCLGERREWLRKRSGKDPT